MRLRLSLALALALILVLVLVPAVASATTRATATLAEIRTLQQESVKVARIIQEHESQLDTLEHKLARLEAQRQEKQAALHRRQGQLQALIGALYRLSRQPPEALLVLPLHPVDTIRSGMLLRSVIPRVRRAARRVKADLETLAALQADMKEKRETVVAVVTGLEAVRHRLAALVVRKKALLDRRAPPVRLARRDVPPATGAGTRARPPTGFEPIPVRDPSRIREDGNAGPSIHRDLEGISDLDKLLDRVVPPSNVPVRAMQRRAARPDTPMETDPSSRNSPRNSPRNLPPPHPGPQRKTEVASMAGSSGKGAHPLLVTPEGTAIAPITQARGRLAMPVRGRLLLETDPTGVHSGKPNGLRSKAATSAGSSRSELSPPGPPGPPGAATAGLVIATRARAQVIAPYDGQVVFAGPFRGYGRILIIKHGEGYHSLLAGLGRLDASTGQWLLAGEPVGAMGAVPEGPSRLYVELRRAGRPVNPLPWLAIPEGMEKG